MFGSALSFADQRPSVFLLFTDGQDTTSWTSAARTLDVLRRTNVVVFPVGAGLPAAVTSAPFSEIFTRQTWMAPTAGDGLRLLQSAADVTGGEFLRINKGARLSETFRGILSQYRQRYLLTYSPSGPSAPGMASARRAAALARRQRRRARRVHGEVDEDGGRRREDGGTGTRTEDQGSEKEVDGTRRTVPGARCRSRK